MKNLNLKIILISILCFLMSFNKKLFVDMYYTDHDTNYLDTHDDVDLNDDSPIRSDAYYSILNDFNTHSMKLHNIRPRETVSHNKNLNDNLKDSLEDNSEKNLEYDKKENNNEHEHNHNGKKHNHNGEHEHNIKVKHNFGHDYIDQNDANDQNDDNKDNDANDQNDDNEDNDANDQNDHNINNEHTVQHKKNLFPLNFKKCVCNFILDPHCFNNVTYDNLCMLQCDYNNNIKRGKC